MPAQTELSVDDPTRSEAEATALDDDVQASTDEAVDAELPAHRRIRWQRVLSFGVLPGLALVVTLVVGWLKGIDTYHHECQSARIAATQAAKDSTIAILSYIPATAEQQLTAAQDNLTGTFRESYARLTHDVVIPGAKQQHISTVADVPAVAPVSVTPGHAVILVFVNQAATVGDDAPTSTASTVRVTLDKIKDRWLISSFDPI